MMERVLKKEVRGKTRTSACTISDCRHVYFEDGGHDFLCNNFTRLYTPNLKRNISTDFSEFPISVILKKDTGAPIYSPLWTKTFKMFNCTFYGTDGAALQYSGMNVILENNLFEYNARLEWSHGKLKWRIISVGTGDRFIRNTVRFNGASSCYLMTDERTSEYK
jgi:hypothetical protein